MITITDKHNCCGCSACSSICPKHCITMQADNEGFLYPKVNEAECIDCGLCEKVCHELHPFEERKPQKVYAAINKDEEVRLKSSSGGIFYLLAEKIIAEGGIVFGARFDEQWQVVIDYAETMEGVKAFMGSKYVQARMETAYTDAKRFLTEGRKVLFSGTPCQIAGLRKYLRKDYDTLYTVDIVCHGVPSPFMWKNYIEELSKNYKESIESIEEINFRNKEKGWNRYCFSIRWPNKEIKERRRKNLYMRGFLANLFLRPSCYNCSVKSFKSGSDITIGEFWGIEAVDPQMFDDKGTTLFIVNTCKGDTLLQKLSFLLKKENNEVLKKNPVLYKSSQKHELSTLFWERYYKSHSIAEVNNLITDESSLVNKLLTRLKRIIK